jgi:hypothetical protein
MQSKKMLISASGAHQQELDIYVVFNDKDTIGINSPT